jgi:hypothetical protein
VDLLIGDWPQADMSLKETYERYFLKPFRTDFRFWLGTSLVYALAFALSVLGLVTLLTAPRVPSEKELVVIEGTLGSSSAGRRVTVEAGGNAELAYCDIRICGPQVRETWNVAGSRARAWTTANGEIWQLEVEGRIVRSLEQRIAAAARRETQAVWMIVLSVPLWLFAIARDWLRYRPRGPLR